MSILRLTKTQKALLAFLDACGGRGQIYTGVRTVYTNAEREVARCNAVSDHFLIIYGLMEEVVSNRPGRWLSITDRGREALKTGKHDPWARRSGRS